MDLLVAEHCFDTTKKGGIVHWQSPAVLTGKLTANAAIKGPCPLVIAESNAIIDNVDFVCDGGTAAVSVVGQNVKVTATSTGATLVRAVNVEGVNIENLVVEGFAGAYPVAVLGHTDGNFKVTCTGESDVISQPLSGTGTYSDSCTVVDLSQLMRVFGRRYEIEFFNKNALDEPQGWFTVLLVLVVVGGLFVLSAHQDTIYLLHQKLKYKNA